MCMYMYEYMYIDHKTRKGIMRGEEEILREGKTEKRKKGTNEKKDIEYGGREQ